MAFGTRAAFEAVAGWAPVATLTAGLIGALAAGMIPPVCALLVAAIGALEVATRVLAALGTLLLLAALGTGVFTTFGALLLLAALGALLLLAALGALLFAALGALLFAALGALLFAALGALLLVTAIRPLEVATVGTLLVLTALTTLVVPALGTIAARLLEALFRLRALEPLPLLIPITVATGRLAVRLAFGEFRLFGGDLVAQMLRHIGCGFGIGVDDAVIMLRMLVVGFGRDAIANRRRVAGECRVFLVHLIGVAAHTHIRTIRIERLMAQRHTTVAGLLHVRLVTLVALATLPTGARTTAAAALHVIVVVVRAH